MLQPGHCWQRIASWRGFTLLQEFVSVANITAEYGANSSVVAVLLAIVAAAVSVSVAAAATVITDVAAVFLDDVAATYRYVAPVITDGVAALFQEIVAAVVPDAMASHRTAHRQK